MNKEEVRSKINEVRREVQELRVSSLSPRDVDEEFKNLYYEIKTELFPLIDEISEAIKGSSDVKEVKELHHLYHLCYQIVIECSNYGRNRLVDVLNQRRSFSQDEDGDEDLPMKSGTVRRANYDPISGEISRKYQRPMKGGYERKISRQEELQILNDWMYGGYDVIKDGISTKMSDDLPPPVFW